MSFYFSKSWSSKSLLGLFLGFVCWVPGPPAKTGPTNTRGKSARTGHQAHGWDASRASMAILEGRDLQARSSRHGIFGSSNSPLFFFGGGAKEAMARLADLQSGERERESEKRKGRSILVVLV